MTVETDPILVINLFEPWTTCWRCNKDTPVKWGLPITNGGIVPTWWPDWEGGVPACETCYEWHQEWSEFRTFDAPLV